MGTRIYLVLLGCAALFAHLPTAFGCIGSGDVSKAASNNIEISPEAGTAYVRCISDGKARCRTSNCLSGEERIPATLFDDAKTCIDYTAAAMCYSAFGFKCISDLSGCDSRYEIQYPDDSTWFSSIEQCQISTPVSSFFSLIFDNKKINLI